LVMMQITQSWRNYYILMEREGYHLRTVKIEN
jgi:hypothetical protein